MSKLINIGFGNVVNTEKVVSIVHAESAPAKRMVQSAKENDHLIDATSGRKTKGVIITDSGHIIVTALLPETIMLRFNSTNEYCDTGEENE